MRSTDDPLGPGFEWRLRHAMDRVQPRFSSPRYAALSARSRRPWRLAPIALAAAMAGVLALSAYAATGSANPVEWTRQAVTVIESGGHLPATGGAEAQPPAQQPSHLPPASASGRPTQQPSSSPRPDPSESP